MSQRKYVSLSKLSTFLDNLYGKFASVNHKHTLNDITNYTVDTQLSSTSTNPVQNKVIDAEFEAISVAMNALEDAIDDKSDSSHDHNDKYYTETEVDTKLASKSDTTHKHDGVYDAKGSADAVQKNLNTVSDTLSTHTGNSDIHVTAANKTNWNTAYTHSQSTHARTDATKVADSTTNGNILINGTETTVYSHPNSGVSAGTYKSVTVNAQGHITAGSNPTTLSGYGITDAETKTDASKKLSEAKTYADNAALAVKNDLLNNAGDAYDTLKELGDLIDDNKDAIDVLEEVAAGKQDKLVGAARQFVGFDENGNVLAQQQVGENVAGKTYTINDTSYTAKNYAEVFNNYGNNKAIGLYSHAEGNITSAGGAYSHAEGCAADASGEAAHAEGYSTIASGECSHAEGCDAEASGNSSHAEGYRTFATGDYQHTQGKYNIKDENNKYAHIVGNGIADNDRSNAHTIDWNGTAWFAGDVKVGGTSQDDADAKTLATVEALADATTWTQIYDSGAITADVNSFSGVDVSGYTKIMVAIKCVNTTASANITGGAVIFSDADRKEYAFKNILNSLVRNVAGTSGGLAIFKVTDGFIICEQALRAASADNMLSDTNGLGADNLLPTGGGIVKCTKPISKLSVSTTNQSASHYYAAGSRIVVWGCMG